MPRTPSLSFVLRQFGPDPASARAGYLAFLQEGLQQTDSPDLEGGGLRRSAGVWEALDQVSRGREGWAFDERVLGSSAFVQEVVGRNQELPDCRPTPPDRTAIDQLCMELAHRWSVGTAELASSSRRRNAVIARALVAFISVRRYGFTQSAVADALHISKQTIFRGLALAEQILPLVEPDITDLLHDDIAAPRPKTAA
jgi:hypothetical protein